MLKRAGIIGCGRASATHISAIEANPKLYKLIALCDLNSDAIIKAKRKKKVYIFTKYKDMLKTLRGKMDLVVVATPNSFHLPQAITALDLGYDVLIEKPVSFRESKILSLDKKARLQKRNASAVLQVRYQASVGLLKKIVENNILGKILSVSFTQRWQRPKEFFISWHGDPKIGGRILYDVAVHYLDIIQWIFGTPEVLITKTFNIKYKHLPFEDTLFSIVRYKNDAAGNIEVTVAAEPRNIECTLFVLGERGAVKLGGKNLERVTYAGFTETSTENKEVLLKIEKINNDSRLENGQLTNLALLYREIAFNNPISLKEASKSIKFIEDIYKKER